MSNHRRTDRYSAQNILMMLEEDGHNKGSRSWGFWLIGIEREWSLGVARNCPPVRKSPSFESQEAYASQLSVLLREFWYCRKMQVFSFMLWHCMCAHDNMLLQSLHWVPGVTMLHHPSPGPFLIQSLKTSLHRFSGPCTMDTAPSSYRWGAETQGVKICHMVGKNQTRDIKSVVSCEVSGLSSTNMSHPVMGTGVCHLDSMRCSYLTATAFPFMPSDHGPAN